MSNTDIPTWTLQDRMAKALEHAHLDAADMASRMGRHVNTIRNWMATPQRAKPTIADLRMFASETGVSYEWLTERNVSATEPNPEGTPPTVPSASSQTHTGRRGSRPPAPGEPDVSDARADDH